MAFSALPILSVASRRSIAFWLCDKSASMTLVVSRGSPAECSRMGVPEHISEVIPRALRDMLLLDHRGEHFVNRKLESPRYSNFYDAIAALTVDDSRDMSLRPTSGDSDFLRPAESQPLLALPLGKCHSALDGKSCATVTDLSYKR